MTYLLPDYGGASLADVLPAVGRALGASVDRDSHLNLPGAPAYVVVLLDGMGAQQLAANADHAPFLTSLESATGTCGVPSTTATSLTSLGTALPPGGHGMVGFTSRIPGTTRVLQALRWDESIDPTLWQPHEPYFATLERAGIATTVLSKSAFESSGLTQVAQRGVRFVGADTLVERVQFAVGEAGRTPSLTYLYDSDPDHTGHAHGVDSWQWRQALDDVDAAMEQLRADLPESVRLLVIADHGMVDPTVRIDIDAAPQWRDGVFLVAGEARFRHLYCRAGAAESVQATWQELLGDQGLVVTREEAVAAGWFGPVDAAVLPRLGDVMVAAGPDLAVLSSRDFEIETYLVGMHGSLTPAEMQIPLLLG